MLTSPAQAWLFKALIRACLLHLDALDERTKSVTEVVRNLYAIKLYAYEPLFGKIKQEKREKEAKHARTRTITRSIGDIIGTVAPPIAAVGECSVRVQADGSGFYRVYGHGKHFDARNDLRHSFTISLHPETVQRLAAILCHAQQYAYLV
jgi:hypothetical protein